MIRSAAEFRARPKAAVDGSAYNSGPTADTAMESRKNAAIIWQKPHPSAFDTRMYPTSMPDPCHLYDYVTPRSYLRKNSKFSLIQSSILRVAKIIDLACVMETERGPP